jgi:hypothetical protein
MAQSKLCYMTNVKKWAYPNVAIFPRKSYREKKTKSSGFISSFKKKMHRSHYVRLTYNYVFLLI